MARKEGLRALLLALLKNIGVLTDVQTVNTASTDFFTDLRGIFVRGLCGMRFSGKKKMTDNLLGFLILKSG